MARPRTPGPDTRYVVKRVDLDKPDTWYAGIRDDMVRTTTDYSKAVRLGLDDARIAVYASRIDRGGVWGIRRADGQSEVDI